MRCWVEKLAGHDRAVATKAAFMLGRLGTDTPEALTALVEALGRDAIEVRIAALTVLDRLAVAGYGPAVARIDRLEEEEEGRSIWNSFATEARAVRARLRRRAGAR